MMASRMVPLPETRTASAHGSGYRGTPGSVPFQTAGWPPAQGRPAPGFPGVRPHDAPGDTHRARSIGLSARVRRYRRLGGDPRGGGPRPRPADRPGRRQGTGSATYRRRPDCPPRNGPARPSRCRCPLPRRVPLREGRARSAVILHGARRATCPRYISPSSAGKPCELPTPSASASARSSGTLVRWGSAAGLTRRRPGDSTGATSAPHVAM